MIFHLKEFNQWSEVFRKVSNEIFSEEVCLRLQVDKPEHLFQDDLSWLSGYHDEGQESIIFMLVDAFRECFTHIIGYHACCPTNIDGYLTKGLLLHDEAVIRAEAIDFFSSPEFPELSLSIIEATCDDIFKLSSQGELYFGLDDNFLINDCGHYLLYGSETLTSIAVNLPNNGLYYRLSRRLLGKPTIFKCRIPVNDMSDEILEELVRLVAVLIAEAILNRSVELPDRDFGFDLGVPLAPENIIQVIHPTKIKDPLTNEIVHC